MKRRTALAALGGVAVLALAGCAQMPGTPPSADLIALNRAAADALLENGRLDPAQPLLVASFVNLDRLDESSRLGRLFSEQVGGRLSNRGYAVVELKLRDSLFFKQGQGALLHTREVTQVVRAHQAQAVVVGTYTASPTMLYVSLKLVGADRNLVLAAHDYALPMDTNVRGLLSY